jgi:NADH dehydrogenase
MMRVLILGAGYAGLRVALELDRLTTDRTDLIQTTLIDRNLYHQHIVLLHLIATGSGYTSEAAIPLDTLLQRRAVRFCQGSVSQIQPLERQVQLADGLTMAYDRLVLALGAETNYGTVPGAREHGLPLRSYDQAQRLRDHVLACFRAAAATEDTDQRRALLSFVVVGGGFTGVQVAGELADWTQRLCREFQLAPRDIAIMLIERNNLLLPQFGPWATHEAERVLTRRGVRVYLSTAVIEVTQNTLTTANSLTIATNTVIWAGGSRAPRVLAESGLDTDHTGRVIVDSYLRLFDQARIFGIGDCARIPDPQGGIVPPTASYAMRQGEHLARTLLAEASGQAPRAYRPQHLGQIVSIGPGEAVGDPLGVAATGLPAALLKQAVEAWYLTTL